MQLKNLSKATQINDFLFWKERDHFAIYFNEKINFISIVVIDRVIEEWSLQHF